MQQRALGCVLALPLMLLAWASPARAAEFSFSGFADARFVAEPETTDWLHGGLGKFRTGGDTAEMMVQGAGQGVLSFNDSLSLIAVVKADQETINGVDALEAYFSWHSTDEGRLSWSVKAGAFFPTISLENDDIGWTSPYTITWSAINTWIGEELRTLGGEGTLRLRTGTLGTFSLIGALDCCNDPTGILIADRGWSIGDRATGLFEHVRLPDATLKLFHLPYPGRTGEFDEIDHRVGWYGGLSWQMAGIGKLSVLRYENQGDPSAEMDENYAWETKFWSFGGRTQFGPLVLIVQDLTGYTAVEPVPNPEAVTKFQSAFLLASYDLGGLGFEDWRASARAEFFQTRHLAAAPHPLSEDGRAMTLSLSWQPLESFRLTGETVLMHSRRGEYLRVGLPSDQLGNGEFLLNARIFF
ncbi:MAG TPA: hypothetical protein VG501_05745 [Rhizomicrobium sp.]|nr:hypothetical protein [Rhizomicrobium sp.]